MKNFKNFIDQIRSSVYDPKFYRELENKNTSYSIYYLLKLSLFISLIATLIVSILFISLRGNMLARSGVETISDFGNKYLVENFPSNLVINFTDGVLSTNASSSVAFPIPFEMFDMENDSEIFSNFVAIDTNENISKNSFEKYDAYMVLSSTTGAFFDQDKNAVNFFDYNDGNAESIPNMSLNQDEAISKFAYFSQYLESILPFLYVLAVILMLVGFTLVIFVWTLVYTLFSALIAFLLGKIWKSGGTYGTWYQKSLHADTLYILLTWTIGFIFPLALVPFANTILVLLVLYFNDNFSKK